MVRVGDWEVVSGVRDPVARMVSAFFQVGIRSGYFGPDDDMPRPATLSQVLIRYTEMVLDWPDWFDMEIEPITGIDVYSRPFPHHQG